DVSFFFFDASTYLILKWEGARKIADKDVPWESFFHDFREINGVKYPFLIESDAPGTDQTQRITAEKIEVNVSLDDSRFGKPNPPAPPPPPARSPGPRAKTQLTRVAATHVRRATNPETLRCPRPLRQ